MKEFDELLFNEEFRYTEEHEWVSVGGAELMVGISDYAQDQLGDIVFVEMPEVGATFARGEQFGTLESVKAVYELYLPVGGEVVAINEAVGDSPELINQDPYGAWIVKIKPSDTAELEQLLNALSYRNMLRG